jgi:hypothetical protein
VLVMFFTAWVAVPLLMRRGGHHSPT